MAIWRQYPKLRSKLNDKNKNSGNDGGNDDNNWNSTKTLPDQENWVGQIVVTIDVTPWISVVNIDIGTV